MMEDYLLLTAAEALAVEGPTGPMSALKPMPIAGGEAWVLPVRVLADPEHAARHDLLAGLPMRTIDPAEWPAAAGPR